MKSLFLIILILIPFYHFSQFKKESIELKSIYCFDSLIYNNDTLNTKIQFNLISQRIGFFEKNKYEKSILKKRYLKKHRDELIMQVSFSVLNDKIKGVGYENYYWILIIHPDFDENRLTTYWQLSKKPFDMFRPKEIHVIDGLFDNGVFTFSINKEGNLVLFSNRNYKLIFKQFCFKF